MPLTQKGHEIMASMKKTYGEGKGERVFYASANKGTITGVHKKRKPKLSMIREHAQKMMGAHA